MTNNNTEYFVAGIDTDTGKTIITGLIARYFLQKNYSVITSKPFQSGCSNISEDILTHRKIMLQFLNEFDLNYTTSPYVFTEPCSVNLAAKINNTIIDIDKIIYNINILRNNFDYLIIEGAGGIMSPIKDDFFPIDLINMLKIPVILVSSNKIGSINHTILTIDKLRQCGIHIKGIVYNNIFETDEILIANTIEVIYHRYADIPYINIPKIDIDNQDQLSAYALLFEKIIFA